MKIPLSAIFDDMWVNLKGDCYADPNGNDPAFAQPLRVSTAHGGRPSGADERNATFVRYLGEPASVDGEETGFTLIVSPQQGAQSTLLYFPDDQHEVAPHDNQEEDEID